MPNTPLIRLAIAGRTVGLSADTLHRAIIRGEVPLKVVRFGGFRYVFEAEFAKWRDSLTAEHSAEKPNLFR